MLEMEAKGAIAWIAGADPSGTVEEVLRALPPAPSEDVRRICAVESLVRIGIPARVAIPALTELVRENASARVRLAALRALRELVPDSAALAPAVGPGLRDPDRFVRLEALRTTIGSPELLRDPTVEETSLPLVADADPEIRRWANGLLLKDDATRAPALIQALGRARNPAAWNEFHAALGRLGPAASAAVPSLVGLLQDPDPDRRRAAVRSLERMGTAACEAVPALEELAFRRPTDAFERVEARSALLAIQPGYVFPENAPPGRSASSPKPAVPARRSAAPSITPAVRREFPRVRSWSYHAGWMPSAPASREMQVIPIRTEAEFRRLGPRLGLDERSVELLAESLAEKSYVLVTGGGRKEPGARFRVTDLRELPDGAGLVLMIEEASSTTPSPRATPHPFLILGVPRQDGLRVAEVRRPDHEPWPARIHPSFRLP
jgi:hypothetical protein